MSQITKFAAVLLACPVWAMTTHQRMKARFTKGDVNVLKKDELFAMTWPSDGPAGVAHVASENCTSFSGNGFACYIENPEHALSRKWVPANATVMEFGARFGSTTCELAKKLQNSGRLVTVEPDQEVWGNLEANIKSHNCHAHVVRGAISAEPLRMLGSGYGGRSEVGNLRAGGGVTVPTYTFDEVEKALGMKVDTLLIDCEGCAQDMMDQIGPKIREQIKTIVIEADMPAGVGGDCTSHCMDYKVFFDFLQKSGFKQVDEFNDCDRTRSGAPADSWCGPWINHYAFIRQ